jgi:hypothetical protein
MTEKMPQKVKEKVGGCGRRAVWVFGPQREMLSTESGKQ